jgi:glycine cleavage system aminomethyltransferase T
MHVNGRPIASRDGDSVLIAWLRTGAPPPAGGTLCLTGDCPYCLATIDGVAYRRTCLVDAREATVVAFQSVPGALPPLESASSRPIRPCRHRTCDVVVIGQGPAGQAAAVAAAAAGHDVIRFDSDQGQHVVGIYPGPLVVAAAPDAIEQVRPRREIVVATGAMALHPVVPGNHLRGLLTREAATTLVRSGVPLGHTVTIGRPPDDVPAEPVSGTLVRFEPREDDRGRLGAVVTRDADGLEHRVPCEIAVVDLGLTPRDHLLRLGHHAGAHGVGDVVLPATLPPPPTAGIVCACLGVTVADLASATGRGFQDLELLKRATLAGTGPCQGAVCLPHLRSFLARAGSPTPSPFTARPLARPLTVGEAASGAYLQATPRTALDAEHRQLGARMDRLGGWWRPWTYGDREAEYAAVREAVSIADLSTLGKLAVCGPDALRLLEHLYPTRVATIRPGAARYALVLNERGHVIDDGIIARDGETRFFLTFTTGGATHAEAWIRDWADTLRADVRILNQTWALGTINVTGPRARALLERAGVTDPPAYLRQTRTSVAGIRCRVLRLSFTGELSYELHHDARDSVALWRALLRFGRDLDVRPHGLETLLQLRLEKGHLIVGQDTDFDSTPRRLGLESLVAVDKPDFVGRRALVRTNRFGLDRQLVGLEMTGTAPAEGALVRTDGDYAGQVTSSTYSPALGKVVLLAWLSTTPAGALPDRVIIDGRPAQRVPTPFYDPRGARARA